MSVLERCPSYKESNKGNKQRQGPTLSVRFTEVSVKRELTVLRHCETVKYMNLQLMFVASLGELLHTILLELWSVCWITQHIVAKCIIAALLLLLRYDCRYCRYRVL